VVDQQVQGPGLIPSTTPLQEKRRRKKREEEEKKTEKEEEKEMLTNGECPPHPAKRN
jgi:hypothetical protein